MEAEVKTISPEGEGFQTLKETNEKNDLINQIQILVQAELATAEQLQRQNDLAEEALEETIRLRAAEQQRRRLAFDTQDMVAGLGEAIKEVFADIKVIRRMVVEFERWAERIDDILLILLTEKSPQKVSELIDDLKEDISLRETDKRKLLLIHRRNLATLQQRAAYHGQQVPLNLANEIEAEQNAIDELMKVLVDDQLPPA